MTNDHSTPRPGGPRTDVAQARRDRRRRTIYASIAGWTLLGAASTGIVACSSTPSTSAAGTTTAATTTGGSAATSAAATSAAASSAAVSSAAPASAAPASSAPASSAPASSAESAAPAATGVYKDGTYTATGTYQSPGGQESVTITLAVAGDTITEASGEGGATQPPSSQYQGEFLDNFAGQIVGKNIDEVSLSKVAGSSLTSGGFNQALETIKSDAKA